jgi:hypothetical protein
MLGLIGYGLPDRGLRARIPDANQDLRRVGQQPQQPQPHRGNLCHVTGSPDGIRDQLGDQEPGAVGEACDSPFPEHLRHVQPRAGNRAEESAKFEEVLQRPPVIRARFLPRDGRRDPQPGPAGGRVVLASCRC